MPVGELAKFSQGWEWTPKHSQVIHHRHWSAIGCHGFLTGECGG
ncbi:MAG: hypothetical protein U7126_04020 [Microcoleus sp.]